MATGGLNTFRENAVSVGWGKQGAWGTDVAPAFWWMWLDGSDASPTPKVSPIRQGDGTGYVSFATKDSQYGVLKIVEYGRSIVAGCALQSLLGSGSDTYTAPVNSTTLSSPIAVNATQCVLVGNFGNVGTLPIAVDGAYGNTSIEIATLDLTTRTGSGPWTYTVAASGTFKKSHLAAATVTSFASHVMTPKYVYDPYTIEVGYGEQSAISQVVRYIDCVCTSLKIASAKANQPMRFEHTWYACGYKNKNQTYVAPTMPTDPIFRHYDAATQWTLNNLTTGNALTVESFDVTLKRSTKPDDLQSTGLTPVYFLPGNIDFDGTLMMPFNSWTDYLLAFFGSTAPALNATDSVALADSQFSTKWAPDALNSLQLSMPTIDYKAPTMKWKLAGGGIRLGIPFFARSNPLNPIPFTATLLNSNANVY